MRCLDGRSEDGGSGRLVGDVAPGRNSVDLLRDRARDPWTEVTGAEESELGRGDLEHLCRLTDAAFAAADVALAKGLADRGAEDGIRVYAILPRPLMTARHPAMLQVDHRIERLWRSTT